MTRSLEGKPNAARSVSRRQAEVDPGCRVAEPAQGRPTGSDVTLCFRNELLGGPLPRVGAHMSDDLPEKRLLERLRTGDSNALGALFELHRQGIERLVRLRFDVRLAARSSPEDVLQETYLDAARQVHRYLQEPRVPFCIWLRGLARERLFNIARDNLKAQCRAAAQEVRLPERPSALLGMLLCADGSSPSQSLSRREVQDRVQFALTRLEEIDREVILMRHFENLSNTEVARALGLSESGATMRYVRALCRLREIWRRELGSEGSSR